MKGLDGLKVVQVECGGMHTVALASDGKVRLYMFLYGAYYTEDHLQFLNYWGGVGEVKHTSLSGLNRDVLLNRVCFSGS